ncbi:hypothetical protein [Criblamydia sequanensis]|uniref:Leucine-rich repeat-containing protein n=1 Tax=Candidatus Criblamydia sequanensis CRIB-18 TaxID=1437425 RepID=A0A090D0N1_9BACT|nr:hypothetical protein [Criblamydia sequanensis]CDR33410.1 hypothetical protein CSEC_0577 [Criblamydia sequanensis CRIB-18]
MIRSQTDLNAELLQILEGPTIEVGYQLEKLLGNRFETVESVRRFVSENPSLIYLQDIGFSDNEVPDAKHEELLKLCPNITSLSLFASDRYRTAFKSIVEFLKSCERITSLSLPRSPNSWSQFSHLTQIKKLTVNEWKVSHSKKAFSDLINSLPNLTALDLSSSQTLDCLELIDEPSRIKSLSVDCCREKSSRIALNRFSNLESLSLVANKKSALSDEILASLELSSLQALNLSHNKLTDTGISSLTRFKALASLDLSSCKNVKDEALKILCLNLQFSHLALHGCPNITDSGLSHLSLQKGLVSLSFGGGEEIHNLSFMEFLGELKTLFIENSKIDEAPESMPMLTHLKKLVLLAIWDAPLVNDAALAPLKGMTHLVNFQLAGSNVTSEGMSIVKALTTKKITWIG